MGAPARVLVIDDRIPAPALGSGYGRMYDCLRVLASAEDLAIDFHPRARRTIADPLTEELRALGISIVEDLVAHLASAPVDVVLMSRPHNYADLADTLAQALPGVPVVYDAEAVYHRRVTMQAAVAEDAEERARLEQQAARMKEREERLFALADHVVCISEDEAVLAREHATGPVTVVEAWLADVAPTPADFHGRRHVGFVAGWNAGPGSPNADGLLWFAREVLPIVRARMPWFRLLVTGDRVPDNLRWLPAESVTFVGRVDDLAAFYDGIRVAISPVRYGAGVKLKSVEAVQSAVPLVATVEGVAGLDPQLAGAYQASDDPREFAELLLTLLSDADAWKRSREIALRAESLHGRTVAAWPDLIREHLTDGGVR